MRILPFRFLAAARFPLQWDEALEQATGYALLQQLQTLKILPIHS
jgi:hypothetical protein